jgi:hypothetical protein
MGNFRKNISIRFLRIFLSPRLKKLLPGLFVARRVLFQINQYISQQYDSISRLRWPKAVKYLTAISRATVDTLFSIGFKMAKIMISFQYN